MAYQSNHGYVPNPRIQFIDRNGDPLTSGTVEVYKAGTTVPYNTYSDWNGTENGTTIKLDDTGSCTIISPSDQLLKLIVRDADGALFATYDNVASVGGGAEGGAGSVGGISSSDGSISVTRTFRNGQAYYDLSCNVEDQAALYSVWKLTGETTFNVTEKALPGRIDTTEGTVTGTIAYDSGTWRIGNEALVDMDIDVSVAPTDTSAKYPVFLRIGYAVNGSYNWLGWREIDLSKEEGAVHWSVKAPVEKDGNFTFQIQYASQEQVSVSMDARAWLNLEIDGATAASVDWNNVQNKPTINDRDLESGDNSLQYLGIQKVLTAGEHITITTGLTADTIAAAWPDLTQYATKNDLTDINTGLSNLSSEKQDKTAMTGYQPTLTPGSNIEIENNVISVTGTLGKIYTGEGHVKVDNDKDTISLTGMDVYQKTADMTGYVPTGDMTGYQTTGDMTAYQKTADMTGYQPAGDYMTGDALTGLSGNWQNTFTAVTSKSGDWNEVSGKEPTVDWGNNAQGQVTSINGSAVGGLTYTGVEPVYVDNDKAEIGVYNVPFDVDSTMTAYMSAGKFMVGVNPDMELTAITAMSSEVEGLKTSKEDKVDWTLDSKGRITGINGSSVGGMTYTGVSPIVVDNTAESISLKTLQIAVDSTMTAYQSAGQLVFGCLAEGKTYSAGDGIDIDEQNYISVTGMQPALDQTALDNINNAITSTAGLQPAGDYVVRDDLTGYVSKDELGGMSGNWEDTYNTVNSYSGNWDDVATTVNTYSGNWEDAANTVSTDSSNWNEAASTVNSYSSNWEQVTAKEDTVNWGIEGNTMTSINGYDLGGGGTTYTAGDGIGIDGNVISVTGDYQTRGEMTAYQTNLVFGYAEV